jgi:hypothetical protein
MIVLYDLMKLPPVEFSDMIENKKGGSKVYIYSNIQTTVFFNTLFSCFI